MESIRKQASKLREQVAKQQQAVLKRLGSLSNEAGMIDEAELLCHQKLHDLYNSTRATKHFQRSIVRGVEAFVSVSSKQMEIGGNSFLTFLHLVPSTSVVDKFHLNNLVRKLTEDCCKYGSEKESTSSALPRASIYFGTSHNLIEEERWTFINILSEQVAEPLRAQLAGAPLEDARHLTHCYDKLHQELESQVAEVFRRQLKSRDSVSAESSLKLQNAETRLKELKSTTVALGREATAAMLSVEDQQQQITFHKLRTMVDAERSYHQHALVILDKLHSEMILEKPPNELSSQSEIIGPDSNSNRYDNRGQVNQDGGFFIARAIHPFDAQADGELNLSVDDYVVVRQVGTNGWSEGECNGKAGWFPSAYIEAQERAPLGKLM